MSDPKSSGPDMSTAGAPAGELSDPAARASRAAEVGYRPAKTRNIFSPKRASGRLLISCAAGAFAFALTPSSRDFIERAMVAWDSMSLALLGQSWSLILRTDAGQTELRAGDEDPGRAVVFVLAVLASIFSLFCATFVLRKLRGENFTDGWIVLSLSAVALSWLVNHTVYTFRYAHLYYRPPRNGGLKFPSDDPPTDLDFAYYAFTIGMCFQVSDVQVTSREVRGATLVHALISFVFNTTIVALALNLMFQVLGSG